ncbi:uncharacterized protein LOC131668483 isoform X1 [Phymastichus coffea]|uniref:uncharacterized protein LOC131668483 isoform X1 n=1 Tax=Phymastichus coffea TaxID=108790 RepID=UPI00273CBD1A|nr:uncharacterized protein LOC131668483 isoform X1 [Phymastichus coffea]
MMTRAGETCLLFLLDRWPSAMRLLLLVAALTTVSVKTEQPQTSKIVQKLEAPTIIDPHSNKLVLRCEYDLGGKELYSVDWYKYDKMLFRYKPTLSPPGSAFSEASDDVQVNLAESSGKQLTLEGHADFRKNIKAYQGTYACEVSVEHTFQSDIAVANVSAAILPNSPPILQGLAPYYQVDDRLDVNCRSAPSYPPAEIVFYINKNKMPPAYVRYDKTAYPLDEYDIVPSKAFLSLLLTRKHFPDGNLNVACKAVIPRIATAPEYKTEKRASLAASNQRLAQELPSTSANSSSSAFGSSLMLLIIVNTLFIL